MLSFGFGAGPAGCLAASTGLVPSAAAAVLLLCSGVEVPFKGAGDASIDPGG